MEGFHRRTSPWLSWLRLFFFSIFSFCVRAARKQTDQKCIPRFKNSWPLFFESYCRNLSTRMILAPTKGATNISLKRLITQFSNPPLQDVATSKRGHIGVYSSLGWMQKWAIFAYLNCKGGELVWSARRYRWLQCTVIQIMKRALILKDTL